MRGAVEPYETKQGERRYRVRWDLPPAADGRRRQRNKRGFGSKPEAAAFLAEVLHGQLNEGRLSVRSDATVEDYGRAWLELKAAQGKRPTSLDNWRSSIEVHVIPRLGRRRVSDLTADDIERLYLDLARHGKRAGLCRTAGVTCQEQGCDASRHDGLAPKTLRHVHGALRAVLSRVVEDGHLARNPCDADRARAALPRRGGGTASVRREDYAVHRGFRCGAPRPGRPAPRTAGTPGSGSTVGRADRRTPCRHRTIRSRRRDARRAGGFGERGAPPPHTAATSMLRAGVPVTTVARVLGHADPGITLTVYAHAVPSDDVIAAAAMERALFAEASA